MKLDFFLMMFCPSLSYSPIGCKALEEETYGL